MNTPLSALTQTLVIQYTLFVEGKNEEPWITPIDKFELDIKKLMEAGFKSLSLEEAVACRMGLMDCPEKTFCLGFWGGFLDNYTLAFPILQKYNIKVAIFITPDMMGKIERRNKKPIMNWNDAQTMFNSGLVTFYPLWNDCDVDKDFSVEINKKIRIIDQMICGNRASFAVAFNTRELEHGSSKFLTMSSRTLRLSQSVAPDDLPAQVQ